MNKVAFELDIFTVILTHPILQQFIKSSKNNFNKNVTNSVLKIRNKFNFFLFIKVNKGKTC